MQTVKNFIKNSLCRVSPELFSKIQFRHFLGKKLNLKDPVGLNAKIMWLKFNTYRNNPLVTKCSDKYAVREYIAECGYSEILNDLYGVWERVDDIEWEKLPSAFVLKCNHGCGYNFLCPDKTAVNKNDIFSTLRKWMQEDFWLRFAELQYRDIPKRIICEKYLGESLIDYKFYCFNGKPMYVLTCVGRDGGKPSHESESEDPKFYFFDRAWKMCPLTHDALKYSSDIKIPCPTNMNLMWDIAEKLCQPFPFVRVDLYDASGQVVFGELTFTPSAGLDDRRLPETDRLFGELLKLDKAAK